MLTTLAKKIRTVTFIGGGNGTHVGSALCAINPNIKTQILTRKKNQWNTKLKLTLPDNSTLSNLHIDNIEDCPSKLIPSSDIIIISSPVHIYPEILNNITPWLKKGSMIGTLFCQGHTGLMIARALEKQNLNITDYIIFGIKYIPWQSKIINYGQWGHLVGEKNYLNVATLPLSRFNMVAKILEPIFQIPCIKTPFIATALSTSNQILHPARYFDEFENWDGKTPFNMKNYKQGSLYKNITKSSAAILGELDSEIQLIKGKLSVKYPELDLSSVKPIKERIKEQYGEQVQDYTTIFSTISSASMYRKSKFAISPVCKDKGVIDLKHRHFLDDIPYGLEILHELANLLDTKVPVITHLLEWHKNLMKDSQSNKGTLYSLGIDNLDKLIYETYLPTNQYKNRVVELLKNINKNIVFCFDIDGTLWNFTAEENTTLDENDIKQRLFPQTLDIMKILEPFTKTLISRSWTPEIAINYLEACSIPIENFPFSQIYSTGIGGCHNIKSVPLKIKHFNELSYSKSRLVFFDNEIKNIRTAEELGIITSYCPQGI